jgi:hypothetical protein
MFKGLVTFCNNNQKIVIAVLSIAIAIVAYCIYRKYQQKKAAAAAAAAAAAKATATASSSSSSSIPSSGETYHYIGAAIGSGLYKDILEGKGGSDNLSGSLSNVDFASGLLSRDPAYDTIRQQAAEMGQLGYSGFEPSTSGLILDPMAFTSLEVTDPTGMNFGGM